MKNFMITIAAIGLLGTLPNIATGQASNMAVAESNMVTSGEFTKKRYTVKGDWEIVEKDGKTMIKFSDKFKTKNGPDLKLFLSPRSVSEVSGKTALEDSVKIGVLKSNKGEQFYTLPENVNLDDFESVLIHCEAYSVLWGGFDIPG